MPPLAAVLAYLLLINLAAFAHTAADKRRARRGEWRTPERLLLWLAAAGGWPASFAAQQLFRHKTRKQPFQTWFRLIAAAQAAAILAWTALGGPLPTP